MVALGYPVRYVPHADHEHLAEHARLAAIVGRHHADGTADLMVFVPGKEPHWQMGVPESDEPTPHTWHHVAESNWPEDDPGTGTDVG